MRCAAMVLALGWASDLPRADALNLAQTFSMAAARSSQNADRIEVPRADERPHIDGHLKESLWKHAALIKDLTQAEPEEGARSSEETHVYLIFDSDHLYIGVRAYDREPKRIIARERQRDADLDGEDSITVTLDPFRTRKQGYLFQVNPLGARRDGLISSETNVGEGELDYSPDWDGIWYAAAALDEEGWSAEIAIPAKTLSFDPKEPVWGFNVERLVARKRERIRWRGARRNLKVFAMGEAGEISGLSGLSQGFGLDIIPYTKVTLKRDEAADSTGIEIKPGLDAFYKLTPSVTLGLTLNTDFAEAEVDDRRVNLTRFPLFFPEKRAFFLQDANYFNFGGIQRSPLPFFSRKIGLTEDGEPIDLLGGIKATGRVGRLSFGVLDVQTDAFQDLASKNLAVGRASLDVGAESAAGLLFTHGDPLSEGENTLGGVDFRYKNSNFWESGEVLEGAGYFMHSTGDSGAGSAFGGRLLYPNFNWNGALVFDQIGERFEPALGFVDLPGARVYEAWLGPKWRVKGIDHIYAWPYLFMRTDLDNRIINRELWLPQIGFDTEARDNFEFAPILWTEQFFEPFELLPGLVVPPGRYDYWRYLLHMQTEESRPVSAHIDVIPGSYCSVP